MQGGSVKILGDRLNIWDSLGRRSHALPKSHAEQHYILLERKDPGVRPPGGLEVVINQGVSLAELEREWLADKPIKEKQSLRKSLMTPTNIHSKHQQHCQVVFICLTHRGTKSPLALCS